MALRIRTFALERTQEPKSEMEYAALAERVVAFSRRAEAALLEAGRRFGTVEDWRDERTLVARIRAFLVEVGRTKAVRGAVAPVPEEDDEDDEDDEEAEEHEGGDAAEGRQAAPTAGRAPSEEARGHAGQGSKSSPSAPRESALPDPSRPAPTSPPAGTLASATDFVGEAVGPDGRTAFERQVRAVLKATRDATAEIREAEAEARMERLRRQALTARPANEGRARYGADHPWGGEFRVRVFPSQDGNGDVRFPVILEPRPSEPPPLPDLNRWQLRSCAACGTGITTGSWRVFTGAERRARYCSYTELLFCEPCFSSWIPEAVGGGRSEPKCEHALPWRVAHMLDGSKYPVCAAAEAFLHGIWRSPIIDTTAVGVGASSRASRSVGARNIRLVVALRRRAKQVAARIDEVATPAHEDDAAEAASRPGAGPGAAALRAAVAEHLPDRFAYVAEAGPEFVAPAHLIGIAEGRLVSKLEAMVESLNTALARAEAVA